MTTVPSHRYLALGQVPVKPLPSPACATHGQLGLEVEAGRLCINKSAVMHWNRTVEEWRRRQGGKWTRRRRSGDSRNGAHAPHHLRLIVLCIVVLIRAGRTQVFPTVSASSDGGPGSCAINLITLAAPSHQESAAECGHRDTHAAHRAFRCGPWSVVSSPHSSLHGIEPRTTALTAVSQTRLRLENHSSASPTNWRASTAYVIQSPLEKDILTGSSWLSRFVLTESSFETSNS